jgi:hypothetical protein
MELRFALPLLFAAFTTGVIFALSGTVARASRDMAKNEIMSAYAATLESRADHAEDAHSENYSGMGVRASRDARWMAKSTSGHALPAREHLLLELRAYHAEDDDVDYYFMISKTEPDTCYQLRSSSWDWNYDNHCSYDLQSGRCANHGFFRKHNAAEVTLNGDAAECFTSATEGTLFKKCVRGAPSHAPRTVTFAWMCTPRRPVGSRPSSSRRLLFTRVFRAAPRATGSGHCKTGIRCTCSHS